jgi:60 kDa SS-A/Ro ribonucleoprotein
MAKNLAKHVNSGTSQTEQARADQVKNNAGGFVFKVTPMQQLRRFLVLGSSGGTYYVDEKKLTKDSVKNIVSLFDKDTSGIAAIDEIVKVSDEGVAPKNDPALFALAIAASCSNDKVRAYALQNLNKVARIGTHMFTFLTYVDEMRGFGKGLQKALARWYDNKGDNLALQVCKYPQRRVEGCLPWSHRDVLRKIHMVPGSPQMNQIFKYVVKGKDAFNATEWDALKSDKALQYIWAHEAAKAAQNEKELLPLIKNYKLVRESIPNQFFGKDVFAELLPHMGMTAMIRNLNRMTECGLLKPLGKETNLIVSKLTDEALLQKERIHPFNVLVAQRQYMCGQSRNLVWTPVQQVVDALEEAFYKSFKFVEPTGKRFLLGLDVSGSMGSPVNGYNGGNYQSQAGVLSCAEAAAAMAMTTVRTEKNSCTMGFADRFKDLKISANDTLEQVLRKTTNQNFGGTDCALPMTWALQNKIEVDVFIIYTDSETYFGNIHPHEALVQYRKKMGIPDVKLIVTAFSATEFSIADSNDPFMLDCCGMDASVPQIISSFVKGDI